MHTLTDEDLQRTPSRLLDDARQGHVTVITTAGEAVLMTLPLDGGAPAAGALVDLAVALYDRELVSLGRRGIATIRTSPQELQHELAQFGP